jgi:mRNA interferase RelE/StbE
MPQVSYSREALRTLRAIPTNTRRSIVAKIEQLAVDPHSLANNVTTLKGEPGYRRLRVGDWRVLYRDDGMVLLVTKVAPREGAYD